MSRWKTRRCWSSPTPSDFRIYTNWTNTVQEKREFGIEDLAQSLQRGVHDLASWHRLLWFGLGAPAGGVDERGRILLEVVATVEGGAPV